MAISVFEIFKIGIGSSSSHAVESMCAAMAFANKLKARGIIAQGRLTVELYGSLGATNKAINVLHGDSTHFV